MSQVFHVQLWNIWLRDYGKVFCYATVKYCTIVSRVFRGIFGCVTMVRCSVVRLWNIAWSCRVWLWDIWLHDYGRMYFVTRPRSSWSITQLHSHKQTLKPIRTQTHNCLPATKSKRSYFYRMVVHMAPWDMSQAHPDIQSCAVYKCRKLVHLLHCFHAAIPPLALAHTPFDSMLK